jgi:hypothetical protein
MTFAQILASSTAVLQDGVDKLVTAVLAFLPIILAVAIPLGLLYAGYRWVTHRGHIVR